MRGAKDLQVLLEEALADFGVRRRMTPGGSVYYANGLPFAATHGDWLYLLVGSEEEQAPGPDVKGEEVRTPERDDLGLYALPSSAYEDVDRLWRLVVRSFELTLPLNCYAGGRP